MQKTQNQFNSQFFTKPFQSIYNKKFDLIVSNPPYIKSRVVKALDDDIKKYEPHLALDGGNDGLDVIKKVITKLKNLKIKWPAIAWNWKWAVPKSFRNFKEKEF